jgi:hypothetical protein
MALIFCPECQNKISDKAKFCPHCGFPLDSLNDNESTVKIEKNVPISIKNNNRKNLTLKKRVICIVCILLLVIVAIFVVSYIFNDSDASTCILCGKEVVPNGNYCIEHTCIKSGCYNMVTSKSVYCYIHAQQLSSENATSALSISDIRIKSNSSYTICIGTITNNGKKNYTYVKVKGAFKDSLGKTVDTDWTYAIGTEGLSPGESSTFRLSVDKEISIVDCEVSILEYNQY